MVKTIPVGLLPPHIATCNQLGVWIEQDLGLVEAMTFFRTEGTIHPITVFNILIIQIEDHHREHIPQTELLEERDFDKRFLLVVVKEHQRTVGGIAGIDREVDRIADHHCPKGIGSAWAQF